MFAVACVSGLVCGCTGGNAPVKEEAQKQEPAPVAKVDDKDAIKKIKITDTKAGTGKRVVEAGDTVYVLYTGKTTDGHVFDASDRHNNEPLSVVIGAGNVIKGWDLGIPGMKAGGERDLKIPGDLAYGAQGQPQAGIPPNAELDFHVKMLDFVKKGEEEVLYVNDIKKGTGREAKVGDSVTVHYVGTLVNGVKFDSSKDRGQPFPLKLGDHTVVPGFETGIEGMRVGGVRTIHIPPLLGYGPNGRPPKIPANALLYFEITLLSVK